MVHIGKRPRLKAKPKRLKTKPRLSFFLWVGTLNLKWIGAGLIVVVISSVVLFYTLPPELVAESVADSSPVFNSKSRLRIKNIGFIPAVSIKAEYAGVKADIKNGFPTKEMWVSKKENLSNRLSHDESVEIPIIGKLHLSLSGLYERVEFYMGISYTTKFLFLEKTFTKWWYVELQHQPDGYSWLIQNMRPAKGSTLWWKRLQFLKGLKKL